MSYILRSALKTEAKIDQLQSGKSLSIPGIDSWEKFLSGLEAIQKQSDLQEVILQEEISWQTHVTLVVEKDFFFAELKSPRRKPQFVYWTPLGQSLSPLMGELKQFLQKLEPVLQSEKFWLMELGIKDEKIYLFQLQPVNQKHISHLFSSDLAPQIVSARLRFSKGQGLFRLLKTELKARKFRNSMEKMSAQPSSIFLNWEFLFHYFRLYCMIHQLQPNAQSFGKFLGMSFEKNWLSTLVKKHLELANYFRSSEIFDPMKLGFEGDEPIYIGKGLHQGEVGKEILVCEEIPLSVIYAKAIPKVILSKEVGLLSHPVLASVENGIQLVLGLRDLPPEGARIVLDFERKSLTIE